AGICFPSRLALRPRTTRRQQGRSAMADSKASPHAIYVAHLENGELAYQWSPAAQRAVFFPRLVCPFTGSTNLEWRVASGAGTVHSTTTVHAIDGSAYNVALIDCDEGFRLMSRVE